MEIKVAFGLAFKKVRNAKNLTQEEFGIVSSRTYVSTIERGLKSVTLEKLEELSKVLDIHPITLITFAYLQDMNQDQDVLLKTINSELQLLTKT